MDKYAWFDEVQARADAVDAAEERLEYCEELFRQALAKRALERVEE